MPGETPDTSNADSKEVFERMSTARAEQYGLNKVLFTLQGYHQRKMNQKIQFEKKLERQEAAKIRCFFF